VVGAPSQQMPALLMHVLCVKLGALVLSAQQEALPCPPHVQAVAALTRPWLNWSSSWVGALGMGPSLSGASQLLQAQVAVTSRGMQPVGGTGHTQ
jgi:hypothetical protein